MRKFHVAISVADIEASVADYTKRVGKAPCVVVPKEYALWRLDGVNLSIRKVNDASAGALRHVGWEDPQAEGFTKETDVNNIVWERFTAQDQAQEIKNLWPQVVYDPR